MRYPLQGVGEGDGSGLRRHHGLCGALLFPRGQVRLGLACVRMRVRVRVRAWWAGPVARALPRWVHGLPLPWALRIMAHGLQGWAGISSRGSRGSPIARSEKVLPGVEEAVKMMHTGDVWELAVPGKLGFGEKGRSASPGKPRIPNNAVRLLPYPLGPSRLLDGWRSWGE